MEWVDDVGGEGESVADSGWEGMGNGLSSW
jgi:hypothetical protein